MNEDINSGDPIGMGMGSAAMWNGKRITAATAYLAEPPFNLTIELNAFVASIILSGTTAQGVRLVDGRCFWAKNDVIVSAGALNSPQLLMLSGIGPVDELKKHGIPVLHEIPHVGRNLQDHCFSYATLMLKPGTSTEASFEYNEAAKIVAKEEYVKHGTGLMTEMFNPAPMGYFQNEAVFHSAEFKELPQNVQARIRRPTVPVHEISTV